MLDLSRQSSIPLLSLQVCCVHKLLWHHLAYTTLVYLRLDRKSSIHSFRYYILVSNEVKFFFWSCIWIISICQASQWSLLIFSWRKSYINLGQTIIIIYYTVSFDNFLFQKFSVFSFGVSNCYYRIPANSFHMGKRFKFSLHKRKLNSETRYMRFSRC